MLMVGLGLTTKLAVPKELFVQPVTPAVASTLRSKVPAVKLPLGLAHAIATLVPDGTADSSGQQQVAANFVCIAFGR
jgi:hypothetical protein